MLRRAMQPNQAHVVIIAEYFDNLALSFIHAQAKSFFSAPNISFSIHNTANI